MDELARFLVHGQPDIQTAISNVDAMAATLSRRQSIGMTEAKKAIARAIVKRQRAAPLSPANQIRQQVIDGERKGIR